MNNGQLSSRYAKVLYLTAVEIHEEKKVYEEMILLNDNLFALPNIKKALSNKGVAFAEKSLLLTTAAGKHISETLVKFLSFLDNKNRLEYIHFIALEYLKYYRKQKNIIAINLITAIKIDEKVLQRIQNLITEKYGAEVEIYEKIDPKIIGGFIFEMDSQQLNASVVGELKRIKEELLAKV